MAAEFEAQSDALVDKALDEMSLGRPDAAVPHLERALALVPHHAAASHALLRALEDAGRLTDALALVATLIAHAPEDPLLHTRHSILLQRTGDIPAAEAASARARILEWKRVLHADDDVGASGMVE